MPLESNYIAQARATELTRCGIVVNEGLKSPQESPERSRTFRRALDEKLKKGDDDKGARAAGVVKATSPQPALTRREVDVCKRAFRAAGGLIVADIPGIEDVVEGLGLPTRCVKETENALQLVMSEKGIPSAGVVTCDLFVAMIEDLKHRFDGCAAAEASDFGDSTDLDYAATLGGSGGFMRGFASKSDASGNNDPADKQSHLVPDNNQASLTFQQLTEVTGKDRTTAQEFFVDLGGLSTNSKVALDTVRCELQMFFENGRIPPAATDVLALAAMLCEELISFAEFKSLIFEPLTLLAQHPSTSSVVRWHLVLAKHMERVVHFAMSLVSNEAARDSFALVSTDGVDDNNSGDDNLRDTDRLLSLLHWYHWKDTNKAAPLHRNQASQTLTQALNLIIDAHVSKGRHLQRGATAGVKAPEEPKEGERTGGTWKRTVEDEARRLLVEGVSTAADSVTAAAVSRKQVVKRAALAMMLQKYFAGSTCDNSVTSFSQVLTGKDAAPTFTQVPATQGAAAAAACENLRLALLTGLRIASNQAQVILSRGTSLRSLPAEGNVLPAQESCNRPPGGKATLSHESSDGKDNDNDNDEGRLTNIEKVISFTVADAMASPSSPTTCTGLLTREKLFCNESVANFHGTQEARDPLVVEKITPRTETFPSPPKSLDFVMASADDASSSSCRHTCNPSKASRSGERTEKKKIEGERQFSCLESTGREMLPSGGPLQAEVSPWTHGVRTDCGTKGENAESDACDPREASSQCSDQCRVTVEDLLACDTATVRSGCSVLGDRAGRIVPTPKKSNVGNGGAYHDRLTRPKGTVQPTGTHLRFPRSLALGTRAATETEQNLTLSPPEDSASVSSAEAAPARDGVFKVKKRRSFSVNKMLAAHLPKGPGFHSAKDSFRRATGCSVIPVRNRSRGVTSTAQVAGRVFILSDERREKQHLTSRGKERFRPVYLADSSSSGSVDLHASPLSCTFEQAKLSSSADNVLRSFRPKPPPGIGRSFRMSRGGGGVGELMACTMSQGFSTARQLLHTR
ncbi:hypothetical protein DIPPA_30421 [Diplonema papillatum]|nr:hypothetical protein DIPPA_30421 [Diplonema papillatum]